MSAAESESLQAVVVVVLITWMIGWVVTTWIATGRPSVWSVLATTVALVVFGRLT